MYPWCYAFSIYSGNKGHLKAPITSISISSVLNWRGIFINIPPQILFFFLRLLSKNKQALCSCLCVSTSQTTPPPQNNVTGISLLDINSRSLSQFCLNFLLLGLESLVSAISVQCSTLAYCVCHHYSSLNLVNF